MKTGKIKLLLLINCVTSVLFALFATVAWFYINESVDNSGFEISVTNVDVSLFYKFYKYNEENTIIETTNLSQLSLKAYDTVIVEKNVLNTIVINFDIGGSKIENQSGEITITATCKTPTLEEGDTEADVVKYHLLSNIIQFQLIPMNITSTEPETIFDTIFTASRRTTNPYTKYTFVDLDDNTRSNQVEISFNPSSYSSQINNGILSVYVVVDYSEELINKNFDDLTITTELSDDVISFDKDILSIEVN